MMQAEKQAVPDKEQPAFAFYLSLSSFIEKFIYG